MIISSDWDTLESFEEVTTPPQDSKEVLWDSLEGFGEQVKPQGTFTRGLFGEDQERPQASKGDVLRDIARSGSRAIESIAGIPGDLQSLLSNVTELGANLAGANPERSAKAAQLAKGSFLIPGSDELERAAKFYSGDYLTPQTEGEEFSDEFIKFTAPLLIPTGGTSAIPKATTAVKTALKGLGATGIGKLTQEFTGSEGAGKASQSGSYFLMSMFNPGGMSKRINSLYNKANEAVPKNATINPTKYTKDLLGLKAEINSSLSPSKAQKAIVTKIDETVRNISRSGRTSPQTLIDTKKSFNADLSDLIKDSSSSQRKQIARYTKRLTGITKGSLREYGKTNPEFWKNFQAADEAYGTKAASEWISNSIEKALSGKLASKYGKGLQIAGHIAGGALTGLLGKGIGSAGAATVPYYLSRFIYRYGKSPTLRGYYNDLIKAGIKGNTKAIRDISKEIEEYKEE